MFSNNQKISARQLQALLLTDWLGKMVLLLPGLIQGADGRVVMAGTAAGILLASVFLRFILRTSGRIRKNYYSYVQKHAGGLWAVILYLVYGLYFVLHTSTMLYLCEEIAQTYLLPETGSFFLILLPAAVGYYLAWGGMEVRGRVSELTAFIISGIFFLMLILALFQIHPEHFFQGETAEWKEILNSGYLVAAGFGGIGILPLAMPVVEREKGWTRRIYHALFIMGFLLLLTYLVGFGIFGTDGMERLRWPVISLMSCTNIQGVFLQRWDILLVGVLLISLFLSAGGGIYYVGVIGETMWGKRGAAMLLAVLVSCGLTAIMNDREDALAVYGAVSFRFCVPVMILSLCFLSAAEWIRGRNGR